MNETLMIFQHDLQGSKLNDIPLLYHQDIERTHVMFDELSKYIASLPNDKKAEDFEDLLGGSDVTSGPRAGITSLEFAGYSNEKYEELFRKFKETIQSERYDYDGLDTTDVGGGEYYDIYNVLLNVWSRGTRQHAKKRPTSTLPARDIADIEDVITKVSTKLELAQQADWGVNKVIKKKNLPAGGSLNEADLDLWLK